MTITALEIQEIRFAEAKKGYDPNEVDDFLERVAADVDTLNRALSEAAARIKASEQRIREAEVRAEEAEERAMSAMAQAQAQMQAQAQSAPMEEAKPDEPRPEEEPKRKELEISEQDISNAFIAAQKSADALKEEARKEAEKVYREAESKGRDIVREALAEKQKTLGELDRLRESCESFRTEYLSLLKHFQSDAQKRLTDFDEIVPKNAEPTPVAKMGNITRDNDAAVAAGSGGGIGSGAAIGADNSHSLAPEAVAPTSLPRSSSYDDVDDLDIEEID